MKNDTISFQKFAKRSQNQKIILDAAEKVFAEAGFAGATTQLIGPGLGLIAVLAAVGPPATPTEP